MLLDADLRKKASAATASGDDVLGASYCRKIDQPSQSVCGCRTRESRNYLATTRSRHRIARISSPLDSLTAQPRLVNDDTITVLSYLAKYLVRVVNRC